MNLFGSAVKLTMVATMFFITSGCSPKLGPQQLNHDVFEESFVKEIMNRAYKWQIANPVKVNQERNDADWARAAFFIGAMRAFDVTGEENYLEGSIKYAEKGNWKPALRYYHADDVARGQVFLDIYKVKKESYMLAGIKSRMDSLLTDPKNGRELWWWCDALFMSPPVLSRLYEITGDAKYLDYLNTMWWDATDFLFDKKENLYYRDERFFKEYSPNGKNLFWSRGNGWVMAGLVQVLERIPKNNSSYTQFVDLFKKMAAKISSVQQDDGLWRASLLDPEHIPVKETSGSAFYTFALAWGINNGFLDKEEYLPVVKKGWQALTEAVDSNGKLTWVQPIGAKPEAVQESDNQEYGTGAFLMAGTEIIRLKQNENN